MTIDEIVEARGLTENTIYNHLMRYMDSGELDARDFVDDEVIDRVRRFIINNPNSESLKEIFEALDEEVSYTDIRIALKCL